MQQRSAPLEARAVDLLMRDVSANRDMRAYEDVFRYYAPRVKSYLLRFTPDANLAEELMQETMITVWNKAPLFDPDRGALSTWIFTIARNRRIDNLRRSARPEFDPDDPAFVPEPEPDPENTICREQEAARLRAEISKLPADQATLIDLAFFGDKTHVAIAESLDLPLGTVKSRLRTAFGRLKAALGKAENPGSDRHGEPK